MTDKKLLLVVLVLLVCNIFCIAGWNKSMDQVDTYREYYNATENFLDELNQHYDWVDAFDPEAYYEANQKVRGM